MYERQPEILKNDLPVQKPDEEETDPGIRQSKKNELLSQNLRMIGFVKSMSMPRPDNPTDQSRIPKRIKDLCDKINSEISDNSKHKRVTPQ
jgi:hypothetical protein